MEIFSDGSRFKNNEENFIQFAEIIFEKILQKSRPELFNGTIKNEDDMIKEVKKMKDQMSSTSKGKVTKSEIKNFFNL